jgi:hypothetical protein
MILSVTTTYMIQLDKPVILTDEYHYTADPTRNRVVATYEVTNAKVTMVAGAEPNVELHGFPLLSSGARSKKSKGRAVYVPHLSILSTDENWNHTNDSSAYDAIVASVLAEVTVAQPVTA